MSQHWSKQAYASGAGSNKRLSASRPNDTYVVKPQIKESGSGFRPINELLEEKK